MGSEHVQKFLKDYMKEELNGGKWTEENKFEKAVCWGYHDASRTFAGIKILSESFWSELSEAIKIKDFFTEKNVRNQQEFDEKHKKMCDALRACFRTSRNAKYNKAVTYGQAQKIINMTFKYLYAYDYHAGHDLNIYKYCHMPLDKYTLLWYRRVKKGMENRMKGEYFPVKSDFSWSKKFGVTADDYMNYSNVQKGIRLCLGENVLEQEFKIWYMEKQIEILSGIIKGMESYAKDGAAPEVDTVKNKLKREKEELEDIVLKLAENANQGAA